MYKLKIKADILCNNYFYMLKEHTPNQVGLSPSTSSIASTVSQS